MHSVLDRQNWEQACRQILRASRVAKKESADLPVAKHFSPRPTADDIIWAAILEVERSWKQIALQV